MTLEQDTFLVAQTALQNVINQIHDDQWSLRADSIRHLSGSIPTLRDIVNRHTYDDAWVPETLYGKSIAEVGAKFDGDLLGTNPQGSYAAYMEKANRAVMALLAEDMDRVVHLSYGDYPTRDYLKHITTYRGFRVYSLAKFLGVDSTLPTALVDGLWEEVVQEVEVWRSLGVFGPAIKVSNNADKQTKLLGITGFLQN